MAPESERAHECKCERPYEGTHTADSPNRCERCRDLIVTNPTDPTLTCSEVVEGLAKCTRLNGGFDRTAAEAILDSWRERRVQELEAEHELFLSQLKTALGIADDGRVWFGTGLLARAETLVKREAEWREQIRKGAHD